MLLDLGCPSRCRPASRNLCGPAPAIARCWRDAIKQGEAFRFGIALPHESRARNERSEWSKRSGAECAAKPLTPLAKPRYVRGSPVAPQYQMVRRHQTLEV